MILATGDKKRRQHLTHLSENGTRIYPVFVAANGQLAGTLDIIGALGHSPESGSTRTTATNSGQDPVTKTNQETKSRTGGGWWKRLVRKG